MREEKSIEERFWQKVKKSENSDECWQWLASKTPSGYGKLADGKGGFIGAHRVSYELHNGKIPEKLCVLHRCDIRTCTNPDHLFLGTRADNFEDMVKKGRQRNVGLRAKLTGTQVLEIRKKYTTGRYSYRELGKEYGVNNSTICGVCTKRSWTKI